MASRLGNARIRTKFWAIVVVTTVGLAALAATAVARERGRVVAEREAKTRELVESATGVLGYFHAKEEAGALSRQEAQSQAAGAVRGLRYSGEQYFWINDTKPAMVMHPIKPELDGTDLTNNADPTGKRLFVEMVDVVRRDGAGFVRYYWPKPGKEKPQPKVSYVQGFEPWGWIVGSGIYVDDVNSTVRAEAARLAGVGALTVGVVALLILAISRSIAHPLARAIEVLRAVAAGDLTRRLEGGSGGGEMSQLAVALNESLERTEGTVRAIGRNAVALTASSQELSAASRQQGASAEQVAAESSAVSAAAEHVSANVATVATGTEEMSASIQEIAASAAEAAQVASAAAGTAEATNARVAKLGESSREIGEVVKAITSVAEQTNLLALNATIEAARAGEAGKGFAVVANEVKELAKETARATEEIGAKIAAIQADAQSAVGAIAEISDVVARIDDLQATIASAVEEQTATTTEIGRSVADAAHGSSGIAGSIAGVASAAQDATAGAAVTQAASEQMARMAEELAGLVGQFRYERSGV